MSTISNPQVFRSAKQTIMKSYPPLFLALICTALLGFAPGRLAQAADGKPPTQLTYQGFLTDKDGLPLGNTAPVNKTIIFRIYDAATTGTIKWSSQQVVTLDKGHFSVLLGEGSAVTGETFNADLTSVFSGSSDVSDRYLQLTVDGVNIAPRLRFLPAPYAVHARTATQLVDPDTGLSSLTISGGSFTTSGSLSAGAITATSFTTSGTLSAGAITGTSFSGNGANLISLGGGNISPGTIANAAISATAAIADTKLATISTALKVANSATTAASANTASAIVARDTSGNFSAGTITAAAFSGSGASLTALNASQLTTGTIANDRTTAASANTASAIVTRDTSGNFSAGTITLTGNVIVDSGSLNDGTFFGGAATGSRTLLLGGAASGEGISSKRTTGGESLGLSFWTKTQKRMTISNDGYIGIGTTSPAYPLHIVGSSTTNTLPETGNLNGTTGQGIDVFDSRGTKPLNSDGTLGSGTGVASFTLSGANQGVSVYAEKYFAGQGIIVFSDRRIKEVVRHSDTVDDLKIVRQLSVTDYRMVDKRENGWHVHKGLIAQEVKALIPGAVSQSRSIVPTVYSRPAATQFDPEKLTLSVTMTNAHDLKAGEVVRLVTDTEKLELKVLAAPTATNFVVGMTNAPGRLFVYGKQVDDFLSVDYNRVFTTGISAMQELAKQADLQAEALRRSEARVAALEEKVSKLAGLEGELAEMKKVLARLAERPTTVATTSVIKAAINR